jgi:two-component system CitB family sensor kinase
LITAMTTEVHVRSSDAPSTLRRRMVFVLVMQCLVVLACVGVTTAIAIAVQERSIRDSTVERTLDVAESLAALDQVRAGVQLEREAATAELQPLSDIVQQASGVDYVVIMDTGGVRITHPTPSERGEVVSTDATEVLGGDTYLGTQEGTLGPTLRAKVPIMVDGEVVGAVSVGILESEIAADFQAALWGLLPWVIGSVIVGCLISAWLTSLVRKRVRRLEAEAREAEAQRRVAAALRDQTHEFNTRLHVIRGLVDEGDNGAALEYIGGIVPVGAASTGVVLADSRARAIVEGVRADATARGTSVDVDENSAAPAGVLTDDDLTVLSNLLRNAVDAAESRVRVLLRADEERVHLEVADDGPGIDPASVGRIFERGVSTKDSSRGVGLDLVRRAVGARGGTIEVGRSAEGGALFTIDMPSAAAEVRA